MKSGEKSHNKVIWRQSAVVRGACSTISVAIVLLLCVFVHNHNNNFDWSHEVRNGVLTVKGDGEMPDSDTIFGTRVNREMRVSYPWHDKAIKKEVKRIVIEDGITHIGAGAFNLLENVTEIDLPDTVVSIGQGSFSQCKSLNTMEMPSQLERIEMYAFSECSSLKNVVLPDGLRFIGASAFQGCMVEELFIPGSVTEIEERAFTGCGELKKFDVSIENSRYYAIDGVLFDRKTDTLLAYPPARKEEHHEIPEGIKNIATYAFWCCHTKDISFPDSLSAIGDYAFYGAGNLESLILNDGVEKIGEGAFRDCRSIRKIDLPDSVSEIGDEVFFGCSELSDVAIDEGNKDYCAENGAVYDKRKTTLICLPAAISDRVYKAPDTLLRIEESAFFGNKQLQVVYLTDMMHSIGESAFAGCEKLKTVYMPKELSCIREGAFAGCSSLEEVKIPEGITDIKSLTFMECGLLDSIYIPTSVISIDEMAFYSSEVRTVFYAGDEMQWGLIDFGRDLGRIRDAIIIFN